MKWKYRWRAFRRVHGQMRSLLAAACLAVGIVTLLLMLAFETGARARIAAILADTGTRMLTINAGEVAALPNRGSGVAMAGTLIPDDLALLARSQLPATRMAAVSSGPRKVEYRENALTLTVTGTQPDYFAMRHYDVAFGRLPDAADETRLARAAVLGARTAELLFGLDQEQVLTPDAALGRTILVGRMPFEVVGILAARGSGQTGLSQDEGVYVPLGTALRRVFNVDYVNSIVVEARDVAALPPLRGRVDALLREAHAIGVDETPDYTLLDASLALAAAERNQGFANIFFRGFALMILGMAGVGIFAVNHLNVKERGTEFGLRRAVGARRGDIARLVLGETLLLGLAGGLCGIALGLAVLYALRLSTTWQLAFAPLIPAQALGAALILSMLAALIPACKAAAVNPLQALNRP